MRSISRFLSRALLIWLAVLWLAAGLVCYLLVERAVEAELDLRLQNVSREAGRLLRRGESDERVKGREEFITESGLFVQLWRGGNTRKSTSLGERNLPRPQGSPALPVPYDATLSDGTRVRALTLRPPGRRAQGRPRGQMVLALSAEQMEDTLRNVAVSIVLVVVFSLLATWGLLRGILARGLRPLGKLSDEVGELGVSSLGYRFSTKDRPVELRETVEKLNLLLSKLEEGFDRERRFGADLAHEIRTPLTEVKAVAEAALRWPSEQTGEEWEDVLLATDRMTGMVDSLLKLSRVQAGVDGLQLRKVDTGALLRRVVCDFSDRLKARGMTLEISNSGGIVEKLDEGLMEIIFRNLISNAVSHGMKGSCVTVVPGFPVLVEVRNFVSEGREIDVGAVFEPFWRGSSSRSDGEHSGLGLALARSCAEVQGLTLEVEQGEGVVVFRCVRG